MRAKLSVGLAAIAGFLLLIVLLYFSIASFTFNIDNYPLSPPLFRRMAQELTDYLSIKAESLSDAFTQREREHMADVLALFQFGKRLAIWCAGLSAPLILSALFLNGRKRLGQGLLYGIAFFAICSISLGIYAAVDFNGWFTAMHKLVFTNDLWILDPRDSQLIQMLPISFFTAAVQKIALKFAVFSIGFVTFALCLRRLYIRKISP